MKVARHEKIIELIRQYEIDTQEELAARLNEAGFKVTQATVSRDIRALKMTKVAGSNGKSRYAILEEHTPDVLSDKYSRVLKDAVIAMNIGQNIVVVKTIPGMAMAAAAALDEEPVQDRERGSRQLLLQEAPCAPQPAEQVPRRPDPDQRL